MRGIRVSSTRPIPESVSRELLRYDQYIVARLPAQIYGAALCNQDVVAAAAKQLIDTTCPLVRRVHEAARELASEGRYIIVVGKQGHVEVRGIVGDLTGDPGITFGCEAGEPQPDIDDLLCVLDAFSAGQQWEAACPGADLLTDYDEMNCSKDGAINLQDILALLAAFAGEPPCPSLCPCLP